MPYWSLTLYGVAAVALILLIVAMISEGFADWYNSTIGAFFRAVLEQYPEGMPPGRAIELSIFIWGKENPVFTRLRGRKTPVFPEDCLGMESE